MRRFPAYYAVRSKGMRAGEDEPLGWVAWAGSIKPSALPVHNKHPRALILSAERIHPRLALGDGVLEKRG